MDFLSPSGPTMDYSLLSSSSLSSTTELITGMMDHDNHSIHRHDHYGNFTLGDDIIFYPAVQAIFYLVYGLIFILGIFGNVLVCYVVGRNKAMQTVTNFFITNLALADILLCALAVPFTPLYTFLGEWIFGRVLCHLVAYAQGTSVYISTLTLTSIAIDRFFVIIYPFKPRMRLTTCLIIIAGIWAFALLATLPYGIFLHYYLNEDKYTCGEFWPSEVIRQVFSGCTMFLQFFLPFIIILFCYIKVSFKLSDRVKAKPGTKNSKKEALERERKRRTNRMLIAMVFIFGGSWLPLNVFNLADDLSQDASEWKYSNLAFFCSHALAMSSTCYNPFLYAWMNENFRKEFKQVLPCFKAANEGTSNRSRRFISQRTNCNGAETIQETLLPTTSNAAAATGNNLTNMNNLTANTTVVQVLETIDELNSTTAAAAGHVSIDLNKATASYTTGIEVDEVIVHYPSPSFSSTTPSGGPACSTLTIDNNNENISNNNTNRSKQSNNADGNGADNSSGEDAKSNEVMDKEESTKNDGNATVITIEADATNEPITSTRTAPIDAATTSHAHPNEEESSTSGVAVAAHDESNTSDGIMNNMKKKSHNSTVLI